MARYATAGLTEGLFWVAQDTQLHSQCEYPLEKSSVIQSSGKNKANNKPCRQIWKERHLALHQDNLEDNRGRWNQRIGANPGQERASYVISAPRQPWTHTAPALVR